MKRIWNALIVLLPILIIYESPIAGIGIIEILIILCVPCLLIKELVEKNGILQFSPLKMFCFLYILLIFLNLIINIWTISESEIITVIFRTGRYIFYWLLLLLIDHTKDIKYSVKIYEGVAVFSILFLILQIVILECFGYYIDGRIPFLTVMNEQGFEEQIKNIYTMGGRPFSIFSEPSSGAQYITGLLAIELFYKEKINIKLCLFLTFGILLIASNTGILLMSVLYLLFLGDKVLKGRIKVEKVIIPVCAMSGILSIFIVNNRTLANRIFNLNVWMGRFGGFAVFGEKFTFWQLLFGHGMNDNFGKFMPGIPQFYYYFGYVGLIAMLLLLVWLYTNVSENSRKLLLYIIILNLGSNMFFGQFIVTIWFFLYGKRQFVYGLRKETK